MNHTRSIDGALASRPATNLSAGSTAIPQSNGEINDQVDALDMRILEVTELAKGLVNRIGPVLRSAYVSEKAEGCREAESNTELGQRIEGLSYRMNTLRDLLNDAHSRLALP